MADPSPNTLKSRRSLNPAVFDCFLKALSPDEKEASTRYARLQKKLAGFLRLRGVSDSVEAANETLDRAAYKIFEGAPVPDVERFCLGIARNVAKEILRSEQREHTAFITFLESLPDPGGEEVERIQRILKPCFEELADGERQLMLVYCQGPRGRARAEYRRRIASEMGMTVLALRMRVTRLRSVLGDCVRRQASGGGH